MQRLVLGCGIAALIGVVGLQQLFAPTSSSDRQVSAPAPTTMAQDPEATTIHNPRNTAAGYRFGDAMAVFGDKILVAAPKRAGPNRPELSHVFLFDLNTGDLLHELVNPDQLPSDIFGTAVALNADYALVGASGADGDNGAAYLFDIETGDLVHKFSNPDPLPQNDDGEQNTGRYSSFGNIVAMSENRVLIGATENTALFGQAFVFDLEERDRAIRLVLPNEGVNERLGVDAAMNDRFVAIKRIFRTYDGRSFGQYAQVIAYDTCTGEQVAAFDDPANKSGTLLAEGLTFGDALALHDDRLLVGSRINGRTLPGSATLYDLNTGAVVRTFSKRGDDPSMNFGSSVGLNGTHAVIATDYFNVGDFNKRHESGEVYVFDLQTGEVLLREDFKRNTAKSGHLNLIVDVSATHFAVGHDSDDTYENRVGAVYVKPLPVLGATETGPEEQVGGVSADCDAAFLQASLPLSEVTAQGMEIATAKETAEIARREAVETAAAEAARAEVPRDARARQIFPTIPEHDAETVRAIGAAFRFHTFDDEIVVAQILSSDMLQIQKESRLNLLEEGIEGTVDELQSILDRWRNDIFCGSAVAELCYR